MFLFLFVCAPCLFERWLVNGLRMELVATSQSQTKRKILSMPARRHVSPIVFVPGITSSPLQARRLPGKKLGFSKCESSIPQSGWYPLYASAVQALNPGCLLWQLQLQPPKPIGPNGDECVADAEGLEITEVGFGTAQVAVLNPGDPIKFELYEKMINMLENLDLDSKLERDATIRFATYDWRKYGDPCWEANWFRRLRKLIEETVLATGEAINLGCHSMGCSLAHVFLNSVTSSWKSRHIEHFIATGPAFAGVTAVLQNFIQGPTYDFVPLAVSTIGRAAMNSFPSLYTLLPARLGDAWSEDMVIVSTPWKNYTISSVYDGSFFGDIELPEKTAGSEAQVDMRVVSSRSDMLWGKVRSKLEDLLTLQGCVCMSSCSNNLGRLTGVLDNGTMSKSLGFSRPWCFTHGKCGTRALRLRRTLNPVKVLRIRHWDFCGGESKALDAGPGFEFFPGVNTEQSNVLRRMFGIAESYNFNEGLSIEQHKSRCLSDPSCTGFDTDGYLKRGKNYEPDKTWRGTRRVKNGIVKGLYMKRPEVQTCQRDCKPVGRSSNTLMCGSDGETYANECEFGNARCWKRALHLVNTGPCKSTYRTPQGCACKSACGAKVNLKKEKGCYVEGDCGFTSATGKRWDFCLGADPIDTGKGFEYFPRIVVPAIHTLRRPAFFESFHVDELQEECGLDPKCGGFTTDGSLLKRSCLINAVGWKRSEIRSAGIYRKEASLISCQKECEGEPMMPVCYEPSRKTFANACVANNFRCLLKMDIDEFAQQIFTGPCQQYGNTHLHGFAQRWAQRVTQLRPPDVPTTCMYITDVDTPLSWRYTDLLKNGELVKTSPGDGTVNAQSAEAPCNWFKSAQRPPVRLMPLQLSGAAHVTMLFDHGFLDAFKRVLLKDERKSGAL